jgi:hypothetical protein
MPGNACMLCGTDLWDVGRYVSSGNVVLCQSCVDVLKQAMDNAEGDGETEVKLPPRIHGEAPDPDAADNIAAAFYATFRSGGSGDLDDYLEDADELTEYIRQAGTRHPMAPSDVRVDAIRFRHPQLAEVRYQILLGGGPGGFPFQGKASYRDGKWRVTREALAEVLSRAGVVVPPPQR